MVDSGANKDKMQTLKKIISALNMKLYFLLAFAVVQFLFILIVNLTKSYAFLDFDSSLGIRHGWEIWKHGLFLKDWSYFSTLEIDSASFFGTGLYILTRNLNFSLGIAHLFFYLLMVFVIYDLLRNMGQEDLLERTLFTVILIFTPYSVGQLDWANMIFISGGAYEFRVLLMFLFIDLFLSCENKLFKSPRFYILLCLGGLLNFWVSLSAGNYVLFMILAPIGLKMFWDIIEKQEFQVWAPANWVMLLNILISFCSWRFRNHMVGPSHRNNLSLLAFNEIFTNLQNCVIGYFYLFRGLAGGAGIGLFSARGIIIVVRFCVALFYLLCIGYLIFVKNRRKGSSLSKFMICYIIVHFMLFLLANTQYGTFWEYRYHILWCSLMLVFVADHVIRDKNFENKWLYRCIVCGLLMGMFLINADGFKLCLQGYSDNTFVDKTIDIADDLDAGAVYMCNMANNSHILRAKEPDLYCVNIKVENEDEPHISLSGNIYNYYSDIPTAVEKNIMIATDEEFEKMPEHIKKAYSLLDEVEGEHNAYFSSVNYWDGRSGFPAESVDMSVDFPFSDGYQYQGIISDEGLLESGKEEGVVLCSPNMSSSVGNYDIILNYDILQPGQGDCYVEVTADEGKTVLKKEYLQEDADQIVLSNLQIENNMAVQVRLWKSSNAVIEVGKIIYIRNHS